MNRKTGPRINFININCQAMEKLDLTLAEYALADLTYHLSNNPRSKNPGWCYASRSHLAGILHLSRKHIHTLQNKLVVAGVLERDEESDSTRTTPLWYQTAVLRRGQESPAETVTKGDSLEDQKETIQSVTKGDSLKPDQSVTFVPQSVTFGDSKCNQRLQPSNNNSDEQLEDSAPTSGAGGAKPPAPKGKTAPKNPSPYILRKGPDFELIYAYKTHKVKIDNRAWDQRHFSRARKCAKQLLDLCEGNMDLAKLCMKELIKDFTDKKWEWTFETILDYSPAWVEKHEKKLAAEKHSEQAAAARASSQAAEAQRSAEEEIRFQATLEEIQSLPDSIRNQLLAQAMENVAYAVRSMSEEGAREVIEAEMVQLYRTSAPSKSGQAVEAMAGNLAAAMRMPA